VSESQYDDPSPAVRRGQVLRALLRPTSTVTGLLLLYYLMPLGERLTGTNVVRLVMGLVLFGALLTWQVRQIRTAEHPRLRAIEALSLSIPLFILAFAAFYYASSVSDPYSFSEGLSRTPCTSRSPSSPPSGSVTSPPSVRAHG